MESLMCVLPVIGALLAGWIIDATVKSWDMPIEQHEEVADQQGIALALLVIVAVVAMASVVGAGVGAL